MTNQNSADIIAKFDQVYPVYSDFANVTENLLKGILQLKDINVHSITSRVKSRESLKRKVNREDDKYTKLEDITDLAGIRIITYFAEGREGQLGYLFILLGLCHRRPKRFP